MSKIVLILSHIMWMKYLSLPFKLHLVIKTFIWHFAYAAKCVQF